MTPEQQNIALAEWAGSKDLPDYLNDLNAVHKLEKKLTHEQHLSFRVQLWNAVISTTTEDQWDKDFISASAAQRCEALLKTLNLWKQP